MAPKRPAPAAEKSSHPPKKSKFDTNRKRKDDSKQKRAVPITNARLGDEDEDAWEEEQDPEANDPVSEPVSRTPQEWKQFRKEQKALLNARKAQKPGYEILVAAKPKWAQLIRSSNSSEERKKLVSELMAIVQTHISDLCSKHDASRIVQSIVKYGSPADRAQVASELDSASSWGTLVRGKYSKFLVLKLIRLLPSHRKAIIHSILPPNKPEEVKKLIVHREAASVLADSFELYANTVEKEEMVRGFWGKEVALFSSNSSREDKEKVKLGLQGILDDMGEVERRKRILREVAANLQAVFANPDRAAATHAIVHRALREYLDAIANEENIPEIEEQDNLRRELFESLQDALPELVHTKDGSRSVRELFAWATPKDRKTIIKLLKPYLAKIAAHEDAQLVLFTIIDVLDDTTNLARSVLPSLIPDSTQDPPMYTSSTGRRALLYPLIGRCTRHFTPALIATISETDWIKKDKGRSKKDDHIRQAEVNKGVSMGWMDWIKRAFSTALGRSVLSDPGGCLVLAEVLLSAQSGNKSEVYKPLLAPLMEVYPSPSHVLRHPPATRLYKSLFQGGHYNRGKSSLDLTPTEIWDRKAFARTFFDELGKERVVEMCVQGEREGTWIVVSALEALIAKDEGVDGMVVEEARQNRVKSWFTEDVQRDIRNGEGKGKDVLLDVLRTL